MKFFRFGLVLIHVFVIILLTGTLLNDYVSPSLFPYVNLLSLAFPALMIVNVFLCLFWIISWKKRSLVFIGATFLLMTPIKRWINWSTTVGQQPNLKIVSFNVKFAQLGKEKIVSYLENTEADLIFTQEIGTGFTIPGYRHNFNDLQIVTLNSKLKIMETKKLATFSNGNAFYADIEFQDKIIRVVNVYLNPFAFDKQMVKPTEDLQENKTKVKDIIRKLVPTFKIHQKEIVDIRKAIDGSPYPVILVGDFNSVPNSYEYYELGRGLTDAFSAVGRGSSTSFHDYKFPITIDYIFTSKEIKAVSYRVDRSVKISDHFPVIAEFKID